jgi:hypothetical protein
LPKLVGPQASSFTSLAVTGRPSTYHHTQLSSVEMKSHKVFHSGWLRTVILLFSFPHVAGMTGVCHRAWLLVEIGSCKLFAQAGLEPVSLSSQPPE